MKTSLPKVDTSPEEVERLCRWIAGCHTNFRRAATRAEIESRRVLDDHLGTNDIYISAIGMIRALVAERNQINEYRRLDMEKRIAAEAERDAALAKLSAGMDGKDEHLCDTLRATATAFRKKTTDTEDLAWPVEHAADRLESLSAALAARERDTTRCVRLLAAMLDHLETRARGFQDRGDSILNGAIVAEELRTHIARHVVRERDGK